jgi:glycosyltransferase involved in cell wall biosynthesis
MRILIWSDAFWPQIGGLEIFCMRLTTELSRRGHECLVITDERTQGGDSSPYHYGPTPVYQFPFRDLLLRADLVALRSTQQAISQLVDTFRPDASPWRSRRRLISKCRLGRRDLRIHPGRGARLRARSLQKSAYHFKCPARPAGARRAPSLASSPARVREIGLRQGIRSRHRSLRSNCRRISRGDHFTGWVEPDRIPALINQHTLILVPSRWQEPFGLVALQSAQMGRPVIASRRGGLPEIVQDGVTGCLFENENCNQLAAHLRLLIDDRAHTEALGRQARMSALQRFDFANFVTAYEQRYKHASLAHGNLQN